MYNIVRFHCDRLYFPCVNYTLIENFVIQNQNYMFMQFQWISLEIFERCIHIFQQLFRCCKFYKRLIGASTCSLYKMYKGFCMYKQTLKFLIIDSNAPKVQFLGSLFQQLWNSDEKLFILFLCHCCLLLKIIQKSVVVFGKKQILQG